MRLDQFDLNLLIAFDVLIQERGVTRAADRGLSWLRARLIATSGGEVGQATDAG